MRFRTSALILALFAGLTACENMGPETLPVADVVDVSGFTTVGKPTKSVETPWGVKGVYDPAQDPDVIAAFENVTNIHKHYGPNKYYPQTKPIELFFEQIRQTQYLDMGRLGCQEIERPVCMDHFNNFAENSIRENCPNPSFGSTTLDQCEASNSELTREFVDEDVPLIDANKPTDCNSAVFGPIGAKYRQDLIGVRQPLPTYFEISCSSFEKP